jgi:hypothetical protein
VEYFSCLASLITNDTICTDEIKSRISLAKVAFKKKKKKKKKKSLFTSKIGDKFKKK